MISYYARLALSLVILLSAGSFPQGKFLPPGTNGFGIGLGYASNEDVSGFGASAGYSINGIFDIGLEVSKFSPNNDVLGEDLSSINISPFMSFIFIKQGKNNYPLSMSVNAAYTREIVNSDYLDNLNISVNGNSFLLGGSIFGNVTPNSENLMVIPELDFSYNTVTLTTKNELTDETIDETDNSFSFGFGLSLGFGDLTKAIIFFAPGVSFTEGVTTFGIQGGFVFPSGGRSPEPYSRQRENQKYAGDIDLLFNERKADYLSIQNIVNDYFLVPTNSNTPMRAGETYPIVRQSGLNDSDSNWRKVGIATVVKIQDTRAALEARMYDRNDILMMTDKLEYR